MLFHRFMFQFHPFPFNFHLDVSKAKLAKKFAKGRNNGWQKRGRESLKLETWVFYKMCLIVRITQKGYRFCAVNPTEKEKFP